MARKEAENREQWVALQKTTPRLTLTTSRGRNRMTGWRFKERHSRAVLMARKEAETVSKG